MVWQNLLLAFLALKCINLAMTHVFRSECRRNAAFVATERGKALSHKSAGVLQSFQSVSFLFCGMRCTANNNCKSLNFKDTVESVCEILSFNKATLGATMKSRPGWAHYEPENQVGPRCHQAACGLGYKCIESCSNKMGYECLDVNECQSSPCKNGGLCSNLVNMYRCECLPGYTGSNCEIDIDECNKGTHSCHEKAHCTNNHGSYSCHCQSGYFDFGEDCIQNLALGKYASQSSTYDGQDAEGLASFGNDGNYDAEWASCALTLQEVSPWWQVDLNGPRIVAIIRVTFCLHEWDMINPFNISVGGDSSNGGRNNQLCVKNGSASRYNMTLFPCHTLPIGRYISVFANRLATLKIAELEVYKAKNIALRMPSSQSSTSIIDGVTLHARFGNDGNITGKWERCSITKDDDMPWWQMDLTKQAAVIAVRIKNGQTWGPHRINPFSVSVGDDSSNGGRNNALCVDDGTLNVGEIKTFFCPTVLHGRYVTVFLNRKEFLQVCEIRVYRRHW